MIPDPLDVRDIALADAGPDGRRRWIWSRLALGLSPTPVPGLVLLPLGMALGPRGLGVLSPGVLSYLDATVSVAVATLGALIGLGLDARRPHEGRLLTAASIEAAFTITLVGGGVLLTLQRTPLDAGLAPWLAALVLGICAAASSTAAIEGPDHPDLQAARLGDLDDVLPIVLGGVALVWLRATGAGPVSWLLAQAVIIALMIAFAGWVLVARSNGINEQRVFALGTLLLLGGTVEYLSLSALLAGLVAGAFWNAAGGPGGDRISRDVRYVQHPLVVLLLLVAGARVGFRTELALLVPVYVIFRIAGKLGGGWIGSRLAGGDLPPRLGMYLLSPGVIAIAFALNVLQAVGPDRAAVVLAIAVAGSIASDLISLLVHPRERPS